MTVTAFAGAGRRSQQPLVGPASKLVQQLCITIPPGAQVSCVTRQIGTAYPGGAK